MNDLLKEHAIKLVRWFLTPWSYWLAWVLIVLTLFALLGCGNFPKERDPERAALFEQYKSDLRVIEFLRKEDPEAYRELRAILDTGWADVFEEYDWKKAREVEDHSNDDGQNQI